MLSQVKYVKTKNDQIIIFPESMNHSDFQSKGIESAGFIRFFINADSNIDCSCYGKSVSLKIKSDPTDTIIARSQLLPD